MEPTGTIVFASVGRTDYGFDIFAVCLPSNLSNWPDSPTDRRLTDGTSVNYNGQFVGDDLTLVYISERTGSARIYLTESGDVQQLHSPPESLFHDRPQIKDDRLYFISAHEKPDHHPITSWSALYFTRLPDNRPERLTPYGSVDFSPAVSHSGKLIAVASYGSKPWAGEFHDLMTDIIVFKESDPTKRVVVCHHGGWPTWSGDDCIYFHRQAEDGWWSIFRVDLPDEFLYDDDSLPLVPAPVRVTPAGVHCFTPAAMHGSNRVAVATRRKGSNFRHIEIFDVETHGFYRVTQLINPDFHHYNPFVSSNGRVIGYHRFRGEGEGETIPNLDPVTSPIPAGLNLLRLNGNFPAFSPSGNLIAFNSDFDKGPGLKIMRSDGSKRWTLFSDRLAFCNSWSPVDENVIFTSIGPIFASESSSVQIGRVTFDLSDSDPTTCVSIKILTKEGTGNNAFPASSADGRHVVFRSGRSGHKNLYIVDAMKGEGEGIFRLTEGPWTDTMPSWSPDGEWIAFSSNRHNPEKGDGFGIYVVRPDGSDLRRISVGGGDMERLNHVCFCGEWLGFTANLGGVTAEAVSMPNQFQPYGELYIVRLDGSGLQRLTWNGYEDGTPAWHPSPRELAPTPTPTHEKEEEPLKGKFDEPLWIKCD